MLRWNDDAGNWYTQWWEAVRLIGGDDFNDPLYDQITDAAADFEDEIGVKALDQTEVSYERADDMRHLLEQSDSPAVDFIGYSGEYLVLVPANVLRMSMEWTVARFQDFLARDGITRV